VVTETTMVQVICPDCRRQFEVPDGAAEAQCPQCGEILVWRSCLDTNEVFTVLQKWETWVHPGCETKHPVDLTHVLSAARPQGLDPSQAPVPRHSTPSSEQMVYSPVQLAEDVEWADQDISGRLIVDSDRIAILPGAGVARPPLSVAWLRDVLDYAVHRAGAEGEDKKRKLFGRKKDAGSRPSAVVFAVPGGQISITSSDQPDVLLARLDEFLRPRLMPAAPAPAAPPVVPPQPPVQPPADQSPPPGPAAPEAPPVAPDSTPPPAQPPTEEIAGEAPAPAVGPPAADVGAAPAAAPAAPNAEPVELPDLEPDTPEGVYESIRKLAELAVLGAISSEDFKTKKAQLLARL
jgi:predicted RNA-binding Zn-ribbon protein involved in translation (DUF1610 family)